MQRILTDCCVTAKTTRLSFWRQQSVETAGPLFRQTYSRCASTTTKAESDGSSGPVRDDDSSTETNIEIMSAQEDSRRYNMRSAPISFAFNPAAASFSDLPIPPPGWQFPSQQAVRGNNGLPPTIGNVARYNVPQSRLGPYPLFYNGVHTSSAAIVGPTQIQVLESSSGVATQRMPTDDVSEHSSDAPSVGEPMPQLTPSQMKAATIPLVGSTNLEVKGKRKSMKSKYLVPSKASGGVPNPSVAYIIQSSLPPAQLQNPRNILVVIDLNGTLLHRPNHKNPSRFVERPHARTFLAYCLKTFTVAIWSSARPENVQKMLAQLMTPEDQAKVVAIWGRNTLGLSAGDYNQRVQCYKRLQVLWNEPKVLASHPEARSGKRWDQTNTVLVDDSKEKARTEPYNLVRLPEFKGNVAEEGFVLPQVHDFLNDCARQRDISSYIRVNPFTFRKNFTLG